MFARFPFVELPVSRHMPAHSCLRWSRSETGTSEVASAVEERRSAAKQLLLDIQRDLGKDKMAEVAGAIISLNKGSERDSKEALLRILKNQPHLHQRLVEFLPRRFSSFHIN